jgi:release factor glutamine methyltransferase
MTIKECVKKYTNDLKNITHIPAKEVEILMLHLLGKNTIWLHLNYNKAFTKEKELEKLVKKRATNLSFRIYYKKSLFLWWTMFIVR